LRIRPRFAKRFNYLEAFDDSDASGPFALAQLASQRACQIIQLQLAEQISDGIGTDASAKDRLTDTAEQTIALNVEQREGCQSLESDQHLVELPDVLMYGTLIKGLRPFGFNSSQIIADERF